MSRYQPSNDNFFSENDYSQVHMKNDDVPMSISREPNVEYERVVSYLTISSKDRNVVAYPNVNHYVINFQNEFKNITTIQLIQAIFPDKNDIRQEPYLLLKIDELEDVMFSNDRNISDAFAIIQISSPAMTGGFINMDTKIHENTIKFFRTPKASLSKMTVRITDYQGVPFNFGNTPGLAKEFQNTFVFKITSLEKKRSILSQRNVY
jgi:hypothetical protein